MTKKSKIIILFIAKIMGLYILSRFLFRKKLRILCYHGFSSADQSSFRPKLYIQQNTFKSRIDYLEKSRAQFVTPQEMNDVINGKISYAFPVLLTIDDGWKSTQEFALPILKDNKIPHIIYLYTDCYKREVPVLDVLLQYVLWRTELVHVTWGGERFSLDIGTNSEALLSKLLSETVTLDKNNLHEKLAEIFHTFKVEYSFDKEWKYFSLLNHDEIKEHLQHGGSFQLHTHHHINPLQDDLLMEELKVNRRIIESVTGQAAEHLCYPSGVYSQDNYPLLKKLGIKSAVTCIPGLNDKSTHPYALKRFLDGENISQIEFEAEMSGFLDIWRRIFRRGD